MQVTISLLQKAMDDSGKHKFLIDGFPRNEENRASFESQVQPKVFGVESSFPSAPPCSQVGVLPGGATGAPALSDTRRQASCRTWCCSLTARRR